MNEQQTQELPREVNKFPEVPDVAKRKYRDVTAPLPAAEMKEFFTDKDVFYRVNYTQSRLRGPVFLTYLSNLKIPAEVTFDLPISQEVYEEVMTAYMDQRMVMVSERLAQMAAQAVLWAKGITESPYEAAVPVEFVKAFVLKNREKFFRWLFFVDASIVYGLSAIDKFRDEYKPEETFEVVDDKDFVGHNVVNLYDVPHFMELYFGKEDADYVYTYFKKQFEEYMFGNQRLAVYFRRPNNFIALMLEGMADGTIDPANLDAFISGKGKSNGTSGGDASTVQAPEHG